MFAKDPFTSKIRPKKILFLYHAINHEYYLRFFIACSILFIESFSNLIPLLLVMRVRVDMQFYKVDIYIYGFISYKYLYTVSIFRNLLRFYDVWGYEIFSLYPRKGLVTSNTQGKYQISSTHFIVMWPNSSIGNASYDKSRAPQFNYYRGMVYFPLFFII